MGMNLEQQNERELLEKMFVAEMMSDSYVAFAENLCVLEAAQKIINQKCHTALVIDRQQQLVGVVTLNDIKRSILESTSELSKLQLKDICTSEILCTHPEEKIIAALERMETRGLYLLPVVPQDSPQQILGVINKEQISLAGDLIATQVALNNLALSPVI
jgi:CBS-domain-containing membrane protein